MFFLSSIFLLALSTFFFVIIRLEFEIYNNEQPEDFTVSTDYVEFVYGGCLYASIILIIINWILVYFMWQEKFDILSITVAFSNEKNVKASENRRIPHKIVITQIISPAIPVTFG